MEARGRLLTGAAFAKGDVLTAIDQTAYKAALASAKLKLATAIRAFGEEQQRARIAEENWQTSGFSGQATDLTLRKPQLEEAQATIHSARAAVEMAERDLFQTRIGVTYDSVVVARNVNPGDYVQVGATIGKIYDSRVYEVVVPLSFDQINRLPADLSAASVVLRDPRATKSWRGTVSRLEGVIDTRNRWRNLIIEINDTSDLLPGQFLTVEVSGRVHQGLYIVPEHFVGDDGALWMIDSEDHLRTFVPNVLFQKSGQLYVLPGPGRTGPVRLVNAQATFLPGQKVRPLSEPSDSTAGIVIDDTTK